MQTSIKGAGDEARAAAEPQCKTYAHTVRISGGITYQGLMSWLCSLQKISETCSLFSAQLLKDAGDHATDRDI